MTSPKPSTKEVLTFAAAATAVVMTGYGLVGAGRVAIRVMRNPWVLAVAGIGALLLCTSAGSWAPAPKVLATGVREPTGGRNRHGRGTDRRRLARATG
jgi:hypothetical protein